MYIEGWESWVIDIFEMLVGCKGQVTLWGSVVSSITAVQILKIEAVIVQVFGHFTKIGRTSFRVNIKQYVFSRPFHTIDYTALGRL